MVYTCDSKSHAVRLESSSLSSGTKTVEPRACLLAITVFAEGEARKRARAPSQQDGSRKQGREEQGATATSELLAESSPDTVVKWFRFICEVEMNIRQCSNPSCRREIAACFGTTKAGDILELWAGTRPIENVRELCPWCSTLLIKKVTESPNQRLVFFAEVGWA